MIGFSFYCASAPSSTIESLDRTWAALKNWTGVPPAILRAPGLTRARKIPPQGIRNVALPDSLLDAPEGNPAWSLSSSARPEFLSPAEQETELLLEVGLTPYLSAQNSHPFEIFLHVGRRLVTRPIPDLVADIATIFRPACGFGHWGNWQYLRAEQTGISVLKFGAPDSPEALAQAERNRRYVHHRTRIGEVLRDVYWGNHLSAALLEMVGGVATLERVPGLNLDVLPDAGAWLQCSRLDQALIGEFRDDVRLELAKVMAAVVAPTPVYPRAPR